jgi:glutamate dehydrogenase
MPRIARAHIVARDIFDAEETWDAIDALDLVVPAATQDVMFLALRRQVERTARRLVQGHDPLALGPAVARYREGARALVDALPSLLVGTCASRRETEIEQLCAVAVPEPLAARLALAEWMPATLDIVDLAERTREPVAVVAGAHFALTDALRLDWLRDRIAELPRADRWQTEARAALRDELHDAHRALADAVVSTTDASLAPVDRVDAWSKEHALGVQRYLQLLTDIEAAGVFDLTTLGVARRALQELGAPS